MNWGIDFLQLGIKGAMERGVSAETIVLLLLVPLTATLVAISRNMVGLNGFGIFVPLLVSVAFVYTGILAGTLLFLVIVLATALARVVVRKLKLPYMPRMAMLVWVATMGVLLLLLVSPVLGMHQMIGLSIFPILLFMMLAEANIEAQITRTWQAAAIMTLETLGIAIVGSSVIGSVNIQQWVLTNPTLAAGGVLVIDFIVGKYKGLRLLEIWRFKKLWQG